MYILTNKTVFLVWNSKQYLRTHDLEPYLFASAISSGNDEAMKHQIFFSMKIFSFSTFVKIRLNCPIRLILTRVD